ncbi:hypothetical protein ACFE04_016355 [Oxalis oulophora]
MASSPGQEGIIDFVFDLKPSDYSILNSHFKSFDFSSLVGALTSDKARLVIEWRLGKVMNESDCHQEEYGDMISLCGRIKNVELAMHVFMTMEAQGLKPTSSVFNSLIATCFAAGQVTTAISLFEIMENSEDYKPNPETYDMFISAFSDARNLEGMDTWYSAKKDVEFPISVQNFESLIVASVRCRDFEKADNFFQEMKASGIFPNVLILESILESLCRRKSLDHVKEFIEYLIDGGCDISSNMVEMLVRFYFEFRYVGELEKLLDAFMEAKRDSEFVSLLHCGIIRLYAMLDRLDDVEKSVRRMSDQGLSFKCSDDVEKVISSYFRQAAYGRLELFLNHIKGFYKLTRSNYDLLVAGYKRAGLDDKLDSVINDMKLARLL